MKLYHFFIFFCRYSEFEKLMNVETFTSEIGKVDVGIHL